MSATVPDVLRIDAGDHIVIVVRTIEAGNTYTLDGEPMVTEVDLPIGFKIAAQDLPEGTVVRRAGVPIGRTTCAVTKGELVHLHNLTSLYLSTHARGEE